VRRAFAFASSKATVRCELSPIASRAIGFHPDLAALAPYCELGAPQYCSGWTGMAPTGWRIDVEPTIPDGVGGRANGRPSLRALIQKPRP
jgi:hypothetical protein